MSEQDNFETGAISFLDILGFKGLWNSKRPNEIIDIFENMIIQLNKGFEDAQERIKNNPNIDAKLSEQILNKQFHTTVLSDTVIIGIKSENKPDALLTISLSICQLISHLLIKHGLFIRGAISYGKYFHSNDGRIFIGEAVDDVATWFDKLNMIGVMVTPRTNYIIDAYMIKILDGLSLKTYIKYNSPLKTNNMNVFCVNWPGFMLNSKILNTGFLCSKFASQSTFNEDVFVKYENTLKFVDYCVNSASLKQ